MAKQIQELQIELSSVTDRFAGEMAKSQKIIDDLQKRLILLEGAHKSTRKELKTVRESNKEYRAELESSRDRVRRMAESQKRLSRELEITERSSSVLGQTLSQTSQRTSGAVAATDNLSGALSGASRQVSEVGRSAASTAVSLEKQAQAAGSAAERMAKLKQEAADNAAAYDSARLKSKHYKAALTELDASVAKLTGEKRELEAALDQIDAGLKKAAMRSQELAGSDREAAAAAQKLSAEKAELSAKLSALNTKLAGEKKALSGVRGEFNLNAAALKELQAEKLGLEAAIKKTDVLYRSLSSSVEAGSVALKESAVSADDSSLSVGRAGDAVREAEARIEQMNQALGLSVGKSAELSDEMRELTAVHNKLSDAIGQIDSETEKSKARMAELSRAIKDQGAGARQLAADLSVYERQLERIDDELGEIAASTSQSAAKDQILKERTAELTAEKARLVARMDEQRAAMASVAAATNKLEVEYKQVDAATDSLAASKRNLEGRIKEVEREMRSAERAAKKLAAAEVTTAEKSSLLRQIFLSQNSATGRLVSGMRVATKAAYNLRLGFIATTAAGGLLVKRALDTAVEFDNLRLTLIAATGSVEAANVQMARASTIAQRYGLEVQSLTSTYGKFMAASRGTRLEGAAAEQVFTSVSKAARVYGLSGDQLTGSLKALEQMISKSSVQMEELKNQLGDRLPGALSLAASAMNMTRSELFKLIESGELAADEFLPKFAKELEKSAEASLEFAQKSPGAAFQRLENSIKLVEASLARSGLVEWLADVSTGLSLFIDRFAEIENMSGDALTVEIMELDKELQSATDSLDAMIAVAPNADALKAPHIKAMSKRVADLAQELERARVQQKKLSGEIESSGRQSVASLAQLSGAVEEHISDMVRASNVGLEKFARALGDMDKAQSVARANIGDTLRRLGQDQERSIEELAKARERGDAEAIQRLEARIKEVEGRESSTKQELLDLERNFSIARAEIQRKAILEEEKRIKEAAQRKVRAAMESKEKLSELDQLLSKNLAAEITGEATIGDIQVPELDLISGLSSVEEFEQYTSSISALFGDLRDAANQSLSGVELAEALSRQAQAVADELKGVDFGFGSILSKEEGKGDIDFLRQNYNEFVDEALLRQEEMGSIVKSLLPEPEQEAARAELLKELQQQFDEEQLARKEQLLEHEGDYLSRMSGLNQDHIHTLMNWDKAHASSKIQTASALAGSLVNLAGKNSKKLLRVQAVADAASTMAKAYTMAAGAAADTPGPWPVRLAAYASSLAMGLSAVAKVKQAFSSAGVSAGGGGGGGGGASASASSSFSQPSVSEVASATSQQEEAKPDSRLVIDMRNLDPEGVYSGRHIESIIEGINKARRDGTGFIEVR